MGDWMSTAISICSRMQPRHYESGILGNSEVGPYATVLPGQT